MYEKCAAVLKRKRAGFIVLEPAIPRSLVHPKAYGSPPPTHTAHNTLPDCTLLYPGTVKEGRGEGGEMGAGPDTNVVSIKGTYGGFGYPPPFPVSADGAVLRAWPSLYAEDSPR